MSHMLTTVIVDDEPLARKGLAIRLKEHDDINIVEQCANGREALEAIRQRQIDLLFLDIEMPGLNGFEVIDAIIKQRLHLPMVVFVTAFEHYALKAFEAHAQDYLLKPVNEQRLAKTLDKIRHNISREVNAIHQSKLLRLVSDVTGSDSDKILQALENNELVDMSNYSDILPIKDAGKVSRVPVKDIIWIDAAGDYMCVHTEENTHILRKTMKQLEEVLDPRQFLRSHRSTIVNKNYIDKFCSQLNGEYYIEMTNGKELKVSRSYKDKVKKAIVT